MLNVSIWGSINLHIIDAAEAEFASVSAFEKLLHFLSLLTALQLSFVNLNVFKNLKDDTETQNLYTLQYCIMCIKMKWTISIITWRDSYHTYVDTEFYKMSDLAAVFHSGFLIDEQVNWYSTIKYLAHASHSTLLTVIRYFEIQGDMKVWKNLRAEFMKNAEVNKWKGMSLLLAVCEDKLNEVVYQNYWYEGLLCGKNKNRFIKRGFHLVSFDVKFRADVWCFINKFQ